MNDAPAQPACPRCGAAIPPDAPRGVCPRCLLADVATPSDAGQRNPRRVQPPPVADLAAAFPELEIAGIVGIGGMGVVYKARQPRLDRWVALKILPPSLGADPAFVERFNREARFLARLAHPNIVSVHDVGQAGGFCYLLMEFVDGVNLRQAMRAGRFSPAEALALVPRICEALQYAHERGVLHRDIKPENILIDAAGTVKIADFGVAKLVGEDPGDITLTVAGARLGTPHYMAPEQIEKPAEVDHRADIYSLGVVFYELLTGELPLGRFAAPSVKAVIDGRVDEIVMRALAKERELRQQSAGEVKSEVERLSTATTPPPAAARPAPPAGGDGRWAGVRVVRPDRGRPAIDVGGVLLAWLAFAPLAAMAAVLAEIFTHRGAAVPALAIMAAVAVAVARGTRRARAAFAAEPPENPPLPRAARIVAAGLAATVALQCLPWLAHLAHLNAPAPGSVRGVAVPDFPLLLASIALWTRHRGWRKAASVFLGLALFGGLAGSLVALVEPTVRSLQSPNALLLGLLAGLLAPVAFATLWHPRVRLAFGEKPDAWEKPIAIATPPAWRRRLAAVFLVLGATLALAGIVNALATKREFETRVIFDVNDPQAFGRALDIPMHEGISVHLPPQPGSAAWNRHPGGHLVLTRFGGSRLVHLASRSSDPSEAAQLANEFAHELVGRVGSKVALIIDQAAVPPMPIRPNLPLSITLVVLGTAIFVFPGCILWLQSRARSTAELPRWADARTFDWLVRVAVGVMLVEALAAFALAIRPRIDAPPPPTVQVTGTHAHLGLAVLPRQSVRREVTLWSNGIALPLPAFSRRLPPIPTGRYQLAWELQRSGPEHWTLSGDGVTAEFTLPESVSLRPNDAFMGPELTVGFGERARRWLWVPAATPGPATDEPDWGISIDIESDSRPSDAGEASAPSAAGPGPALPAWRFGTDAFVVSNGVVMPVPTTARCDLYIRGPSEPMKFTTLWSNGVAIPLRRFNRDLDGAQGDAMLGGHELVHDGPGHWTLSTPDGREGFRLPDDINLVPNDGLPRGRELNEVKRGGRIRRWLWLRPEDRSRASGTPRYGISEDCENQSGSPPGHDDLSQAMMHLAMQRPAKALASLERALEIVGGDPDEGRRLAFRQGTNRVVFNGRLRGRLLALKAVVAATAGDADALKSARVEGEPLWTGLEDVPLFEWSFPKPNVRVIPDNVEARISRGELARLEPGRKPAVTVGRIPMASDSTESSQVVTEGWYPGP